MVDRPPVLGIVLSVVRIFRPDFFGSVRGRNFLAPVFGPECGADFFVGSVRSPMISNKKYPDRTNYFWWNSGPTRRPIRRFAKLIPYYRLLSFEIIFFAHLSQRRLLSISSFYLCFIIFDIFNKYWKEKTDISKNISFKMLSIYCFLLFMPIITSNVSIWELSRVFKIVLSIFMPFWPPSDPKWPSSLVQLKWNCLALTEQLYFTREA